MSIPSNRINLPSGHAAVEGNVYWLEAGALQAAPLNADGTFDHESACDVDPAMLDAAGVAAADKAREALRAELESSIPAQALKMLEARTTDQLTSDYTESVKQIAAEDDDEKRHLLSTANAWIAEILAGRIGWVALDALDDRIWTAISAA